MYVTDRQFATILLESWMTENHLIDAVIIASKLLKRYGQAIYTKGYNQLIENIAPEASVILHAAKQANKNSTEKLRHITKLLKSMTTEYKPTFVIQSNQDTIEKVESYLLQKVENAQIDKQTTQTNMVNINGEGLYYKRSVDKDVRTLLWLYN
jgi:hypothetical protein